MVASDRISAFDVVLPTLIPDKGRVLTGLSVHWFHQLDTPNHLITTDLDGIDGLAGLTDEEWDGLRGRSMVVRRAEVIPMECVVRGYLYGSSWHEYAAGGGPTTEHLPAGLAMAERLDEPIFTPATKADTGHDENLTEAGARVPGRRRPLRGAEGSQHRHLPPCRRLRRRAGDPARRHQIRVRHRRRGAAPRRRGSDPGQLAVLARRRLGAGRHHALLRQAAGPRLAGRQRVGQSTAGAGPARRGRRRHPTIDTWRSTSGSPGPRSPTTWPGP